MGNDCCGSSIRKEIRNNLQDIQWIDNPTMKVPKLSDREIKSVRSTWAMLSLDATFDLTLYNRLFPCEDFTTRSPSHNFMTWYYCSRRRSDPSLLEDLKNDISPFYEHTKEVTKFFTDLLATLDDRAEMSAAFRNMVVKHTKVRVNQFLWRETFVAIDASVEETLGEIHYLGFRKHAFRTLLTHLDREVAVWKYVQSGIRRHSLHLKKRDDRENRIRENALSEEELVNTLARYHCDLKQNVKKKSNYVNKKIDHKLIRQYVQYVNRQAEDLLEQLERPSYSDQDISLFSSRSIHTTSNVFRDRNKSFKLQVIKPSAAFSLSSHSQLLSQSQKSLNL